MNDRPSDAPGAGDPLQRDQPDPSALLNAVNDGIYQLDSEGHFVDVNDALTRITGYNRETLLGKHASFLLDSEEVVRGETAIRSRLRDGGEESIRLTHLVFTADNEAIPCEAHVTPVIQDGEFVGVAGVLRVLEDEDASTTVQDLSERRQAFDALAEASADGIIMLDDDSDIRYANPAVERILGYTREELVGSPKMKIIPERLRQVHAEALQRYLDSGEKHIDWTYVELPGLHKEGHEIPLAISLNEFEHDGEHYFVGTFRDISKRKEAERELERQNERLDRFASMLAHELRNPLNIASGYLDFIDGNEETVDRIARNLDRIDQIIDVLLMLARGRDEVVDGETADIETVARAAWENTDVGSAGLQVDAPLTLRVNGMHLHHLFENLFRNAIQHGEAETVVVGTLADGFFVADDGCGIPEEERESVVRAGYSTRDEGIGLGLTFVTQLAVAYGWECSITESDEGGVRFEFTDVETVEG